MKSKTRVVKILLLILTFVLTVSVLAGCKKNDPTPDTDSQAPGDSGNEDILYDENGYLMDSLPELNYHDDEVTVLGWNAPRSEFETEYGDNVIDNAIFDRNATVEARLGITLSFEITNGSVKYCGDYKQKVLNAFNAGDYWDIIASYTRSTAICASAGLLKNLGGLQDSYLDFSQPWWSDDVIEKTSVGNTFYFATGDISTNLIQATYCMYFNADLIDDLQLTSPYEMVANNEWTLDNVLNMTKNIYLSMDENETVEVTDRVGIVGSYYAWPAVLHGCGLPIVERDAAGSFVMNSEYKGEKAMGIMNKLADAISAKQILVHESSAGFVAGTNLFFIIDSGAGMNAFSDVEFEYGCVPLPKYTVEQETYYSTVRQPITLYGMMNNLPSERIGEVSAVLECLASEGYRQTTPVIFEECMKYLRSTSQEMTDMLQLIRDTAWFDCARIYAQETKYVCDAPGYVLQDGGTWENYINDTIPTVEGYIKALSTKLLSVALQ